MPSRFEIVQEKIKQTEALLTAYAVRSQIAVERTETRYAQLSVREMSEVNREIFYLSSSDFRAVVQENKALKDLLKLKDERIWIQSENIGNLLVLRTINQMEQEIDYLLSDAKLIAQDRDSYRNVFKS